MILRTLFKKRGFGVNIIACVAFLCLMVLVFGLPGRDLLYYFIVSVILVVGLIGLAVLGGYLLRKILHRNDDH